MLLDRCRQLYNQIELLQVIDWHVQGFIVVVMHKMLLIAGPKSCVEFVQIWVKCSENALKGRKVK